MSYPQIYWTPDEFKKMQPIQEVKYIVIHHTAGADVPIEKIHQQHKEKGWIGIGYHLYIRADGHIERGRPEDKQGAHAEKFNHISLSIALSGNFSQRPPTPAQITALKEVLLSLCEQYPQAKVLGHMRLNPTECPGNLFPWDNLWSWLKNNNPKNDFSGVPPWALPAMQWAVSNQLVNTPMGTEDFYRAITVLHTYDKMKK